MILPDFVLQSRVDRYWQYSGIDSPDECLDKKYFYDYPYPIDYRYNSRGFRDQEWPDTIQELSSAIWCVGDSFTVGIGQPSSHTWPNLLSHATNCRCINVSMDGASNQWIARRTHDIIRCVRPKTVIVLWSYLHRREHADHRLPDEDRRLHMEPRDTCWQDLDVWNLALASLKIHDTDIKHFVVPRAFPQEFEGLELWRNIRHASWPSMCPADLDALPANVQKTIQNHVGAWSVLKAIDWTKAEQYGKTCELLDQYCVTVVPQLDIGRDGHHFDIKTTQWMVDLISEEVI